MNPPRRLGVLLLAFLAAAVLATSAAAAWGGPITASTGETVNIQISDAYPLDPEFHRHWAESLVALVHGPEITRVTVYVATPREISRLCGSRGAACYEARNELIVTPGEDFPDGTRALSVLAHEYGHHVARHRVNPPWLALDWGTKRWASAAGVCAGARSGMFAPGDQGSAYRLNPGEGFAESYRLLNERLQGVPETPWRVVDPTFYPSEAALRALHLDVVSPWLRATTVALNGRLLRRGTVSRQLTVRTPLDGVARFTVTGARTAGLRLDVRDASGRLVARTNGTATRTICGQRVLRLRVTGTRGAGAWRVTVSRP